MVTVLVDTRHKEVTSPASTLRALLCCAALVAMALYFAWLLALMWPFTPDDSYITFRYSRNLADGLGPTWNPGASPIEGYTSFLWMILLAIPHALSLDPVAFAKVAGVACTIATLTVVTVVSHRRTGTILAAGAATCALATLPIFVSHAATGMETALATLTLTVFLVALSSASMSGDRRAIALAAICGLLAGLTRPEANGAVVLGLGCALALASQARRADWARMALGCYILPGAMYYAWRFIYYGLPLPLPFYVKAASSATFMGIGDVSDFLGVVAITFGVGLVYGLPRQSRGDIPSLAAVGALLLFWMKPEHIIGYEFRFLAPLLPWFAIVSADGWAAIVRLLRGRWGGLIVVIATCVAIWIGSIEVGGLTAMKRADADAMLSVRVALGRDLAALRESIGDPLLVIEDAGAIPYYSEWATIDSFGLNDPQIARSGRRDPDYILERDPDLIIVLSKSGDTFAPLSAADRSLRDGAIARGYVDAGVRPYLPSHNYWLLARPGLPVAAHFATR